MLLPDSRWVSRYIPLAAIPDSNSDSSSVSDDFSYLGKGRRDIPCESVVTEEEALIPQYKEWKEFVAALKCSPSKTPLMLDAAQSFDNNLVHLDHSLTRSDAATQKQPFASRCSQLREVARLAIWLSLLNHRVAESGSDGAASLGSMFPQLVNVPSLLVSYINFQ